MRSVLFLARFCVLSVVVVLSSNAAWGGPDAQRQRQLQNLVRQDCGSCHGMTLKGGLGKALLPSSLKNLSVSDVTETILDGVPGTPMPPWRELLNEQEAKWIAESLKNGSIQRGNVK